MASGIERWFAVVALLCAAVAMELLPPRPWQPPRKHGEVLPQEVLRAELIRRAVEANQRLERMRWADSLVALTLAAPADDDGVRIGVPEGIGGERVERFRSNLRAELASLDRRDRRVNLGFFLQPYDFGSVPGAPLGWRNAIEYYIGQREGRPYCVAVMVRRHPTAESLVEGEWARIRGISNILGQCRMPARYGMPGPGIRPWLDAGGYALGEGLYTENPGSGVRPCVPARTLFGLRRYFTEIPSVDAERCLAGSPSACKELLTGGLLEVLGPSGKLIATSPVTSVGMTWPVPLPGWGRAHTVLARAEAMYGTEAFARFWRSDAPVDDAFRAAFGVDLGDWVLARVSERVRITRAGPALSTTALLGSLLVLLLAAGVGVALQRTRRVG